MDAIELFWLGRDGRPRRRLVKQPLSRRLLRAVADPPQHYHPHPRLVGHAISGRTDVLCAGHPQLEAVGPRHKGEGSSEDSEAARGRA